MGWPSRVISFSAGVFCGAFFAWRILFETYVEEVLRRARPGLPKAVDPEKLLIQAPDILYDMVAREWRCKVATRDGLGVAQRAWAAFSEQTRQIPGVVRVQRLCCGTCLDFRIVVTMKADAYKAWKSREHHPESEVLDALRASEGCSEVRSQLLSIMDT